MPVMKFLDPDTEHAVRDDDKVSDPAVSVAEIEGKSVDLKPISLEEIRL
jgi:hypothetical protein